jgi:hypothetical protein
MWRPDPNVFTSWSGCAQSEREPLALTVAAPAQMGAARLAMKLLRWMGMFKL